MHIKSARTISESAVFIQIHFHLFQIFGIVRVYNSNVKDSIRKIDSFNSLILLNRAMLISIVFG